MVNLPKSGRYVLTADAAAMSEILDEGVLPAVLWNAEAAMKSLEDAALEERRSDGLHGPRPRPVGGRETCTGLLRVRGQRIIESEFTSKKE